MEEYLYLFIPAFIVNYLLIYINSNKVDFSFNYQYLKEHFINNLRKIDFIEVKEEIINEKINEINLKVQKIISENKFEFNIKDYLEKENINIEIFSNIIVKDIIPDLNNFLSLIYSKISDKTLNEVLYINDKYINSFSNRVIRDLKIHSILNEIDLLELTKDIKIKDIINNTQNISFLISNYLKEFIKKDFFKSFLFNIIENLFIIIEKNNTPIVQLINPNLQVKLYYFIENNLVLLLKSIKNWIIKNKNDIDLLIENTIEEHFEKQEILGQIKLIIKDIIGLKVSESFNIVEKVIIQIENYFNKSASSDFVESIMDFLEEKTLKDVIDILNLNKEKVFNIIYNFILSKSENISSSISNFILNLNINDLIKFITNKQINISGILIEFIKIKIKEIIENNIETYKNVKIKNIFTEEKFNSVKSYIPFLLMFGQSKIKNYIDNFLNDINLKKEIIKSISENISIKVTVNNEYIKKIGNLLFDKFNNNKYSFLENIEKFLNKNEIISFYNEEINKLDKKKDIIKLSLIYSIIFDLININLNNILSLIIFPISFYHGKNLNNKFLHHLLNENKYEVNNKILSKLNELFLKENKLELKAKDFSKILENNISYNIEYIYSNIKNFKIKNLNEISNYVFENTKILLADFLSNFIKNYVENKNILDLLSKENIIKFVSKSISEYDLKSSITEIKENIKNYDFYNLNLDKYINIKLKIGEYVNFKEKLDFNNLNISINNLINNFLTSIIKNNIIDNELSPDKEVNSLFKGELIRFTKSNINKITISIIFDTTINKLKKEKEAITNNIIKAFRKHTEENFLYDLGNSIFDIEKDIEDIINILIDEKLNLFFIDKEKEIESVINSYIELLSYKKLEEIGISQDSINLDKLVLIINDIYNKLSLNTLLDNIINDINYKNISIDKLINTLGFNNLDDLLYKFKDILIKVINKLLITLENDNIKDKLKLSFLEFINNDFVNYKLSYIFDNEFISRTINKVNNIINDIYLDNDIKNKNKEYSDILFKKLHDISIYELFFKNNEELDCFVKNILNNQYFNNSIQKNKRMLIKKIIS
jgi:hypothetical protein